ncbi:MAG: cell division protein FtsZ [Crocinitomicaceae bacterium]|nr:cell division protein FtsZ [Flavobacteriia bacterium]NDC28127.1 cell division protein FtsZ [Crocinitomicaceae bacterium]NDC92516.1 cell division protein FtsZ [Flavobacteriales bacterium]
MEFDLPRDYNSIIKVIGVGGGGSNAVNHMFNKGIVGVDFIVCNTDRQALDISPVPYKIQLGTQLTDGRGAGMLPEVGMAAANENIDEIRELLSKNTKMVFVTAGMGGGTGTGAAPVIAKVAKDLGILTVGIVTIPFNFEGKKRRIQAEEGLNKMRENVDTLLVINNERLREFGKDMSLTDAFSYADDILTVAARGIAEVISVTGVINVDFNDVNTVLKNSGHAIMGSASAEGENRALEAVSSALSSPLLMDNEIDGARYVLLNITYGSKEVMMDEITEITDYIQEAAGATADVIWGHGLDSSLGEKISITLIAAGLKDVPLNGFEKAPERKVVDLHGENNKEITSLLTNPVSSVEGSGNSKDAFSEEPFLKSEQITDNTIPAESISQNFGEKKSFDLFESAVEINPSAILDVNEDTNFVEEITFLENEITSNSEEKDVQPEFSWDIGVSNSDASESSTKIEEKEEIVRHMLEDEVIMELDSEVKHTTPEEQQKIAQERSFKIMEYTNKLKNAEGIADFENEPAYVRRNISLNQSIPSSEESVSRFGLSEEEDGKSGLRSNNFLHDNVD